MMLHLVAGGKGVAALPEWIVSEAVQRGYVSVRPLGEDGLHRTLYAAVPDSLVSLPYVQDFLQIAKQM